MSKISELSQLSELAATDEFEVVDKSDTSMASTGTNKRMAKSLLDSSIAPPAANVVVSTSNLNYNLS